MMGMTTAVGGGILRDLLLGITPPAALRDPLQALVAIATSLLVFLVWKRFHPEGDHRNWEALLLVADSIGLGIFSVHGAAVAVRAGLGGNVFLTLLVGMLTGVGGGVLRDLCCMERPYIFTKHIYACASRPARRRVCAVERRREPGAADRLRADGGAAALCRGIPLEPAESVNT